jgi:hypothetical protein
MVRFTKAAGPREKDLPRRFFYAVLVGEAYQIWESRVLLTGCAEDGDRGLACKHIICPTIARAKTKTRSGCGGRFPNRGTVEVGPELAEASLGDALEGERYCRPCARRRGVL